MFRSFNKAVNAARFVAPNNLLLAGVRAPVYLSVSSDPSIEHVNTVKALFKTITRLESHKDNSTYKTLVERELKDLNSAAPAYVESVRKYVELGGRLTAQALTNLYATADQLQVNAKWLEVYAQPQVPYLFRNMSVENLKDLIAGLNKFNGSQDYIRLAEEELSKRNQQPLEYVRRAVHEITEFEEAGTEAPSSNLLIQSIESKRSVVLHYAQVALQKQGDVFRAYFGNKQGGYVLDA